MVGFVASVSVYENRYIYTVATCDKETVLKLFAETHGRGQSHPDRPHTALLSTILLNRNHYPMQYGHKYSLHITPFKFLNGIFTFLSCCCR